MKKLTQFVFNKTALCAILFAIILISRPGFAQPVTEPFNYVPDAVNGLSAQSSGAWVRINTGDSILVNSGNLKCAPLTTSTGNKISYSGAGADYYRPFTNQTSGTVYASFLLNVNNISLQTTTGGYTFGFMENNSTSNFGATVWIRNTAAAGTSQYNLGINPRTTPANTVWAPEVLDTNHTYLIIIAYTIVAGAGNDSVSLWINPVSFGGTPSTPVSAFAVNTGTDLTAGVQRFFCRQDAAGTTPAISMDELRIGTSWKDVTPTVITEDATFPPVFIDGNLTVSNCTVTLTTWCTVADTLSLLNGNVDCGVYRLDVGLNQIRTGTLIRTTGTVIGAFGRCFPTTPTPEPVIFPVGTGTYYRPVTISIPDGAFFSNARIVVSHFDGGTGGNDLFTPVTDGAFIINRYSNMNWALSIFNVSGFIDVTLDGKGQTGITDEANLRVLRTPNNGTADGNHVPGSGTVAKRNHLFVNFPEDLTLQLGGNNVDDPLPVELSSFNFTSNANKVMLDWSTVSEQNNSGFDVERKVVSGAQWEKIGNVKGNGTSNVSHKYLYTDGNLISGKYNYRLKQIDFNGNFEYFALSNEVVIGTPKNFVLAQNYPNPFNPSTTINYELPMTNYVSLKVYDMMGKEVASLVNGNQEEGFYSVKFDASKLSSGIYFYILKSGDFTATKKLMLIK